MAGHRSFSTGVAWIAAGNWIEQGISFLLFIVLARMLGAESFGVMAMAAVFVTLAEFLVRESVSEGLIAQQSPSVADYNAAFWLLLGFGLLLFALAWAASGLIADLYREPQVKQVVPALMATVPMIAMTAVPVAILRRELRFRALAIRAIAGVVAGGAVGLFMAFAGYGVWSLVGQRVTVVAVNVALAWISVGWRPGTEMTRDSVRRAASFGGTVVGLRTAEMAAAQVPALLIGATLGPVAVGLYSIAWRIVELLSFLIVTPLRVASQPVFAALTRTGGNASALLVSIARMTGVLAFPLFAGVAAVSAPFVDVAIGPSWAAAAPVLAILGLIGVNACIDKVPQSYCLAAGRAGAQTVTAWAAVALGVVFAYLALPLGLPAVAAGFALAQWLIWPLRVAVTARIAGLSTWSLIEPHLRPALVAALMAGVVVAATRLLAPPGPTAALALGIATGLAAFAGLASILLRDRVEVLKSFLLDPASAAGPAPEDTHRAG